MWKNAEERTYVHQVTAVSGREVRETMADVASGDNASESKSFGSDPRFVEWRGKGFYVVEFNPFLQVFGELQPDTAWKSLTVPLENPSSWYSQGRVRGWDSVSVPAGSFKALRVELNSSRATIKDYVRWSAESPAKTWGLYPRKGTLTVGSDADIAIVDMKRSWSIDDAKIQSRSRISPWQGYQCSALPIHTLVRGRFVMKGRVLNEQARGTGRSVHAIQQMPPATPKNADATMAVITSGNKAVA
jgi:hypothetical protein